jgi:calcium-dependent protein kinase
MGNSFNLCGMCTVSYKFSVEEKCGELHIYDKKEILIKAKLEKLIKLQKEMSLKIHNNEITDDYHIIEKIRDKYPLDHYSNKIMLIEDKKLKNKYIVKVYKQCLNNEIQHYKNNQVKSKEINESSLNNVLQDLGTYNQIKISDVIGKESKNNDFFILVKNSHLFENNFYLISNYGDFPIETKNSLTLYEYLKEEAFLKESLVKALIKQLLLIVSKLHTELGIMHRYICLQNIIINTTNMKIKLKNFRFSEFIDNEDINNSRDKSFNGIKSFKEFPYGEENLKNTHFFSYYIDPNILSKKYNEKCDIWSIGVVMYLLLTGVPPFQGNSDEEIFDNILKGNYASSSMNKNENQLKNVSKTCKDLLYWLLTRDNEARVSLEEAMKHEWLCN